MNFIFKRMAISKYFGGLIIGVGIVIVHVIATMLPLLSQIDGNNYWFSTYNRWISFDSSNWTIIFFWVLPIISAVGTNQIIHDDISSGFFWQQVSKQGYQKYIFYTFPIIFLGGFLIVLIPLTINLFFAWALFPTIKPDFILNFNSVVLPQTTFMAGKYYTNPVGLVLLYLILPSLLGGLFALISGMLSFYLDNQFITITVGFVLSLFLTILTSIFPHQVFSPVLMVAGVGFGYVPSLSSFIVGWSIAFILTLLLFVLGVRRHAFD